jgi:hypothetical protein
MQAASLRRGGKWKTCDLSTGRWWPPITAAGPGGDQCGLDLSPHPLAASVGQPWRDCFSPVATMTESSSGGLCPPRRGLHEDGIAAEDDVIRARKRPSAGMCHPSTAILVVRNRLLSTARGGTTCSAPRALADCERIVVVGLLAVGSLAAGMQAAGSPQGRLPVGAMGRHVVQGHSRDAAFAAPRRHTGAPGPACVMPTGPV